MLAAKAIQDWPLYSGQEASTRYMDFSNATFANPLNNEAGEQIQEARYVRMCPPGKVQLVNLFAYHFRGLKQRKLLHVQVVPEPLQIVDAEIVRVELTEPLSVVPTGFATQSPARIALDFPGATNAIGRSQIEINQGNLKSINVVEATGRSRVVLNLKQATSYRAEIQGKALLVHLDPVAASAASQPSQSAVFAEAGSTDIVPIKDVDFRRGADGSGRVIVSLENSQVGVDLQQLGKGLTVEFIRSSLPEGLRRRLDVADFGTPVQIVSTAQQGDRVRMVIEPIGDWEHSAYQSDNQFVVEVRQKKIDLNKLTQGPGYSGEKLSLNFQYLQPKLIRDDLPQFFWQSRGPIPCHRVWW